MYNIKVYHIQIYVFKRMKNQNVAANLPYIYLIAIPLMVKTKVCYA